jgi:hypothetical protein
MPGFSDRHADHGLTQRRLDPVKELGKTLERIGLEAIEG